MRLRSTGPSATIRSAFAGIAQLVEHNLAKVGVAGSSPVSRFADGQTVGGSDGLNAVSGRYKVKHGPSDRQTIGPSTGKSSRGGAVW